MRSREIERYKSTLSLSKRQREILIGLILGDAHLEKLYTPNLGRLKIEHSDKQKDYVDWLYREFRDWVRTKPRTRAVKAFGNTYLNYGFSTYGHRLLGEFKEKFYKEKRKIVPNDLERDITPLGLAVWYMDKEDQDKALELLMKSSEINRERQQVYEHRYNLACDYFDMGLVFTNKNDFTAAKEFYNKSRRLFEKLKLKNELSDYYFNLGEIYIFEKQYQKALDHYTRGLKIDEFQDNKPSLASDYNMLGELYVEMDDLDKAERFFEQSIVIAKQINARPELAAAYYNLGLLYKKRGQRNKARDYLRQAQDIYRLIDTSDYQEIKQELLSLDTQE
jgi:tetratricopeptide (TPR) repeat protein